MTEKTEGDPFFPLLPAFFPSPFPVSLPLFFWMMTRARSTGNVVVCPMALEIAPTRKSWIHPRALPPLTVGGEEGRRARGA